ncbi:helix-turn-helix transcriptional regulator [Coriobacteriia bacterium Es71-Z0120]|uniref:heat shock protein transcriptional repressor HspR n=1 Tax=Parvivirga hydrogeniphila TaxID=2939460 RepID=UPI002260D7DC|nr:helix-turn-helix transcriptional regulator [Parvivirga hydrogeniphila]MCL4078377.1 helix-turn-helix transcriptional regulator [Parvivirga hydrogeniphila]
MRSQRGHKERPLYMISVAAQLAGMHPQTLRIYERKCLIKPKRSAGNTRLYSDADIERLRLIQRLTQDEGVNLAGVVRILELEDRIERLQAELEQARAEVSQAERRLAIEIQRVRQSMRADIVHVPRGGIVRRDG